MGRVHEFPSTDSIGLWDNDELPDSSSLSTDVGSVNATCTPLEPLHADATLLPARSFGLTGSLSLHDYRKHLAQAAECIDDPVDRSERTLKRKTATSNLNRPPALSNIPSYAVSISSSAASSPPPLSPSYSQSIISQRSELDDVPEQTLAQTQQVQVQQVQSDALPAQGPRVNLVSANLTRPRPNRKRLNTFREKLEARGQAHHSPLSRPQESDMLATTQAAAATISHGGASFEILNPRKSLDLARIVSFIEDVDTCSWLPADQIRDSHIASTFSIDQGLDRASLSQFTDASLPSHYSSQSLYTSLSAAYSTPKSQSADIPSSSPGVHDRVRSLSDYSRDEYDLWRSGYQNEYIDKSMHPDLVGESPKPRMFSISERLEDELDVPVSEPGSARPASSSQPTFYSESEIGEPGSPVYANGEWSQVDERDRGIFYELPSPSAYDTELTHENENDNENEHSHTFPYDTYLSNTMSRTYQFYDHDQDPYDHMYYDPHVQSVLAAANAENMGLRSQSNHALDGLQRRFQSSLSLSGEAGKSKGESGKQSFSQRRKLRRFFSWRSGN
ncbi:hypothetical protein N7478_012533 [Penicillium angulare]|uniref:uncharacterized protein n=1 Tax=Penicillium angulare TaxID=116970 RepID=UPI0025410210|nr:uncharacterized protein N7478_012533 [Penicillium angulare]KAJ5259552.1 hypothetical protein N7478_012533 [Penicillium angulare]